jgi:hypothetical protein
MALLGFYTSHNICTAGHQPDKAYTHQPEHPHRHHTEYTFSLILRLTGRLPTH